MAGEVQEEGMEEEARVVVEKVEVARAAAREAAAMAAMAAAAARWQQLMLRAQHAHLVRVRA